MLLRQRHNLLREPSLSRNFDERPYGVIEAELALLLELGARTNTTYYVWFEFTRCPDIRQMKHEITEVPTTLRLRSLSTNGRGNAATVGCSSYN